MTIADQEELARVKTELAAAVSNGDTAAAAQLEKQLAGLAVVEEPVESEPVEEKPARPSRKQATSRLRGGDSKESR